MFELKKKGCKFLIMILICSIILSLVSVTASGLDVSITNSPLYSKGTWISFDSDDSSKLPDVEILKSDLDSTTVEVNIHGVQLEQKRVGEEKFQVLTIPRYGFTTEVGKAQLPVMRTFLAIPPSSEVELKILDANYSVLQSYNIYPVQEPLLESLKNNFTINKTFYSSNLFYPDKVVDISDSGLLRDYRIVQLQIYPIRFNPDSNELRVYDEIKIELKFAGAKKIEKAIISKNLFEKIYEKSILNYNSAKKYMPIVAPEEPYPSLDKPSMEGGSELKNTSNRCDYLVITHDNFYEGAGPLAEDKRDKGLEVMVVNLSDIYNEFPRNDNDTIRDFIDHAYHNWTLAPTYILLIGDIEYVPTNYGLYHNYEDNYAATDLFYATVAGDDYFPDIFVGRISVKNTVELDAVVEKIVGYPYSGETDWYKKAMLVSDYGYFEDTSNWVYDFLTPHNYAIDKLYDSLGTATTSNIMNGINDGRVIVNYRGHGAKTGWGTGNFYNSDVLALNNVNKYPLVISPTCRAGWYDAPTLDCFGETWVKAAEKGGIAFWGSTRVSYGGYNDELDKGVYKAIFDDGFSTFGAATTQAKIYMYNYYGDGYYTQLEFEMFNVLGDPATPIPKPLPEPHDISLTHLEASPFIRRNEVAMINVTVNNIGQNDENNIEVRFLVDGIIEDTQVISILNSDSSQKLNFTWSTEVEGNYNITIYAVPVAGEDVTSNNLVQADISVIAADILLVDDDECFDYKNYYSDALTYYGYSHVIWTVSSQGAPSASDLQSYEIVVWLTGDDYSTTLTDTDQANLQSFLDNGGRLFISGQDIGYDIDSTSFYQNYLHANYIRDDVNLYTLNGVSGDPLTDYINISISGGDGANNQDFPSEISPSDTYATPIFYYEGDGIGALRVDTGTYRAVYFAFGFEAINDHWDRAYLMYRIIKWLDIEPPRICVPDYGATYVPAGTPVIINANVYDQSNISSVFAEIENPDENVIATIQLFDDGMHFDGSARDGVYGNSWTTDQEEKDYYVDFLTNDTWGNFGTYNNTDRFTTVPFAATSDILLVDDSAYTSYISYYEDALTLNGYSYNLWEPDLRGEIDSSTINSFKICIWSAPYGGPSSTEQSVLREFLDNGGRLFISGQDIGFSIGGTPFYQNYLHANYIQDDTNLYALNGVFGDPITSGIDISIAGGDGANNQFWPSEIDPIAPAESVFYYDATSSVSEENLTLLELPATLKENLNKTVDYNTREISSTGTGALRVDTGTYRVVYSAFGFEAINDHWDRAYLMYRIINWLDIEPPWIYVSDYGATYTPAGNPVIINANVYDQSNISSVFAEIENPDENVIATIQLFDDGMHFDGSARDGLYGNSWTTHPEEKDYYLDFIANDTWGNSGRYNNTDRFTTVPFAATSDILLVDDSVYTSYISYYEGALTLNGYSYDLWEQDLRGEIDSSTINSFKICVWSSPYGGPNSNEQSVLREFLDNSGRLFISGQDIGYSIGGTPFYQNYLHANYIQDDTNLYTLNGVSGDPITNGIDISIAGGDGANNQWWPSEIDPIAPAESIFYYDATSSLSEENLTFQKLHPPPKEYSNKTIDYNATEISSTGTGALRVDTETYRVVYFAFGFEAINDQWDRGNLMYRIINCFQIPPAEFNDVYACYGEDTDGEGLYDYLVVDVGVVVTEAGRYKVDGSLYENGTYNSVDYAYNTTDLSEGNQTVQLRFKGIKIRQNKYNGTYDLRYLGLYNASYPIPPPVIGSEKELEEKIEKGEIAPENVSAMYGEQFDYRYYAYTTSYYSWTEFQKSPAEFTGNFNDYGEDSDGDGLYDYLVIEAEITVTKGGEFEFWDDLYYYNETTGSWEYGVDCNWHNYSYLDPGVHNLTIKLSGIEIRDLRYNGTFKIRLYLDGEVSDEWLKIDDDEYYTKSYNYTDFQIPPAEFNDVYSDYGEDTDGDGLHDYLVVNVGVNVTEAGDYEVSGSIYETGTYDSVDYAYNTTYLTTGNQTVQLRFEGIKMRQDEYNGTYDLKYLYLYNSYQFDYRYYAYTTSYYNWTEFQIPPAEFNDVYDDSGEDTDGDGLYDYLVVDVGVNVTEAGDYRVSGKLYENGTYDSVDYDSNTTYLDEGNQTVQLKFEGIKIRQNEANGTFDLKYLYLYDEGGIQLDYIGNPCTTSYYNYTDFERPPAEFNDIYLDYGEDTDGNELYDYLVVDIGVNVTEAGDYKVKGYLYENGTYNSVDYDSNTTYLDKGNQTVQLKFEGIKIRQNEYNGTYDLKSLYLYNYSVPVPVPTPTPTPISVPFSQHESKSTETESISVGYGEQLDYRYYAYTTSYYNYTEFEESMPDAYEPDDNDSLANYISVDGGMQTHDFHIPGDYDWLKFNATKGESYTVETSELGNESDTYLYLYDTDGITEIDNDDDKGIGLASKIVWNCSISGTYYLMVRHFSSSAFGPETRYTISVTEKEAIFDTGSPLNPYPSIMGNHTGTIKSNHTVIATKLYTYPCVGTGGHTEYAEIRNATWNATATWEGYVGDWHNISFDKTVVLLTNETYNYTIHTGSYPQIHHKPELPTENGWINCTEFVDANGKKYYNWIPAIRLE